MLFALAPIRQDVIDGGLYSDAHSAPRSSVDFFLKAKAFLKVLRITLVAHLITTSSLGQLN
jgi:hypothetical protein